jgi:hypothetical protein
MLPTILLTNIFVDTDIADGTNKDLLIFDKQSYNIPYTFSDRLLTD